MYTWAEIEGMLEHGDIQGRLTRDDLPTPALTVDLDALESNIARMAKHARDTGRALRPHGKTHKCPQIARKLIGAGAVGCCAAKIGEAEAFARHGVSGLLITTAVIGKHKIERAVRLASRHPATMFCVDHEANVDDLNQAAAAAKITLNLMIDLWVGRRTGIQPGAPALGLAQHISGLKNVRLSGIQAYAGQASHVTGWDARRKASMDAMSPAVETRCLLEKSGIACPILTGASTGTYNIDSEMDGINELQPGSFLFMDVDYGLIGGQDGNGEYRDFQTSLSVLTTVVSKPSKELAVVDGGFKAFSTDRAFPPLARGFQNLAYTWGGDEHGKLNLAGTEAEVNVGDLIEFTVPHCDPTVNLYDRLWCLRGDAVEGVWPIAARGMAW